MSEDDTLADEEQPVEAAEDPFEVLGETVEDTATDADPLAGVSAEGPTEAGEDSPFQEMVTEPIDESALWGELTGEADRATGGRDETGTSQGRSEAVVTKASYCERCEYFTDPPAVGCTHQGTDIVELVDTDHFRVLDCPIVARRGGVEEVVPGSGNE